MIGRSQFFTIVVIVLINSYIGYSLISFSSSFPEQYAKNIISPVNVSVEFNKNPYLKIDFSYNPPFPPSVTISS